jgi:hypothetical protein
MATQKITGNGSKESLGGRKLRLDLIPPQTLKAIAQVLGFGAAKYDAHNWMRGLPWMELAAGVKRHLGAFEVGEEIDPESGLPHLAHALCGLMFLHYEAHGPNDGLYRPLDDDRVFINSLPIAEEA